MAHKARTGVALRDIVERPPEADRRSTVIADRAVSDSEARATADFVRDIKPKYRPGARSASRGNLC